MGVVHGRGGGCRRTGVGSFICCLLEEIVLQGVEWRDTAFWIVVQHAQDQVWKRTNTTMMLLHVDVPAEHYNEFTIMYEGTSNSILNFVQ